MSNARYEEGLCAVYQGNADLQSTAIGKELHERINTKVRCV